VPTVLRLFRVCKMSATRHLPPLLGSVRWGSGSRSCGAFSRTNNYPSHSIPVLESEPWSGCRSHPRRSSAESASAPCASRQGRSLDARYRARCTYLTGDPPEDRVGPRCDPCLPDHRCDRRCPRLSSMRCGPRSTSPNVVLNRPAQVTTHVSGCLVSLNSAAALEASAREEAWARLSTNVPGQCIYCCPDAGAWVRGAWYVALAVQEAQ